MDSGLRRWLLACFALGAAFVLGFALQRGSELPGWEAEARTLLGAGGAALITAALAGFALRVPLTRALSDDAEHGGLVSPAAQLFWISFAALFIEVMLIRYCNSQLRIFAFYKNVALIASYVGLGVGCALAAARPSHTLRFLLWLVPCAVFLACGAGAIDGALGMLAAFGSSEHLLGDAVVRSASEQEAALSQLYVGAFCVAVFLAIAGLFTLLGRTLGHALEQLPRLRAYGLNLAGSLLGVVGFALVSALETPPWVWFALGLAPLAWLVRGAQRRVALVLAAASVFAATAQIGGTIWSRYQKLVVIDVPAGKEAGGNGPAFLILISDVFYQLAIDLRPENVAAIGFNPYPHYDRVYESLGRGPGRVLIVGAGSGNDVAAALRAGAEHVDAVDIDPAIVEVGRRLHPERPYSDPRVTALIDDARAAFHDLPPASYDTVIFGLLDSHTQLGVSSVRLDNYVFTLESLAAARELLRPGGRLVITAATFRPWFRARLEAMVRETCGGDVRVFESGNWVTYVGVAREGAAPVASIARASLPSDDWPYLYLPERSVPRAYLVVIAMLMGASVFVLWRGGLRFGAVSFENAHLALLGAAFLLMEVSAINKLALLFGTTWIVSAVTIALVLALSFAANATVALRGALPYGAAYPCLFAALAASFAVDPAQVLGRGALWSLAFGLLLLTPIFFAGTVFSRSFASTRAAGAALGFNMLGSALGGWLEYATMATGIRSLALLAGALYLGSLFCLVASRRTPSAR